MKNLIIILILICTHFTHAQSTGPLLADKVEFLKNDSLNYFAISIIGVPGSGSYIKLIVDYGDQNRINEVAKIKEADGTVYKFASIVSAFNIFSKYGWEYIDSYRIDVISNTVTWFVFKRRE